jgi:hypothetical protein
MPNDPTPVDLVKEAAAQLTEARDPGSVMTSAVLFYETSTMGDDGDIEYEVNYSVVTDSSFATAVGVATLGLDRLMEADREDG